MEELIINRDVKISIGDYRSYNKSKVLNSNKDTIGRMDFFASAYLNDELVGSLRIKYVNASYEYREVFVLENKRGLGIAKKLMIETLKLLITKNRKIILYVDPENEIASELYKKLGFELIKKNDKFGDKYEYLYQTKTYELIKIKLLSIIGRYVSSEEMTKQKSYVISKFNKFNIDVTRNIEMYADENYFIKIDKRTTDQEKYIFNKDSLYLGKFPKEIIINEILRSCLRPNVVKINNFFFNNSEQMLVLENIPLRVSDFFTTHIDNIKLLNSICYQIFIMIAIFQEKFEFMHKDLTTTNILLRQTNKPIIVYTLNNRKYKVETYGYIPVLIDLSVSTIFKFKGKHMTIYDTESLDVKFKHNLFNNLKKNDMIIDIKKYNWYIRDINKFIASYDIFFFITKLKELDNNLLKIPIIKKYLDEIKHFPKFSESYISPSKFLDNYNL